MRGRGAKSRGAAKSSAVQLPSSFGVWRLELGVRCLARRRRLRYQGTRSYGARPLRGANRPTRNFQQQTPKEDAAAATLLLAGIGLAARLA